MLDKVNRHNVSLLSGLFRERADLNRNYLFELDSTCLLQNFYLEAGVVMPGLQVVDDPAGAKLHWGWEAPTCQLRGHFLGHWLSAAAAYCASNEDIELKAKLDKIISELARCQQLNGGEWIGSIPEKYFDMMARGQYVWSPQYVMHKTVMGLTDVYKYTGNEQALDVVSKLADWYVHWTDEMLKRSPDTIYKGEQGGMLEVWADLYGITKDEKYMKLAERYSGNCVFDTLDKGGDALTNDHANAGIPLSHGAARMYEITGDEKWKTRTERFFKCAVIDRGTYATSGANSGEFWVPPHQQGHFLGASDQEFCTVYNLVRTADYLFKWTGDTKYADYIERCLYNGFLAQQNASTGMPTYFLPLKHGSKKKWGSKTHDFWCCHGTMVQAQTLYPDLVYFTDSEGVIVSQYIPSKADITVSDKPVHIEQTTDMKNYNSQTFFDEHSDFTMSRWSMKFTVSCEEKTAFVLKLRLPEWVSGEPEVTVNGNAVKAEIVNSYIKLAGEWQNDTVGLFFPSEIRMERLEDMPYLAAAVDGPIVLAGITGCDCGLHGDYSKPADIFEPQIEHTYSTFPWKQNEYITKGQEYNITFKPLYDVMDEEYTVYFSEKK